MGYCYYFLSTFFFFLYLFNIFIATRITKPDKIKDMITFPAVLLDYCAGGVLVRVVFVDYYYFALMN